MREPIRRQRGSMAVLVAVCLPMLLGIVALALDLGRAYVLKTEVQNAMDACALAASASLTAVNDPQIFDVARAHALALTDAQAQGLSARPTESVNRVNFQSEALSPARIEVSFSANLDGPFVAATGQQTQGLSPAQARYARCSYTDGPRALWLMPVLQALGFGSLQAMSVPAQAVAALSPAQSACAVPIAVCAVPGKTAAEQYGLTLGQRMSSVDNPANGYSTGNFGWVDFTPPQGGASELTGLLEGAGACGVQRGQLVGQPGMANSVGRAWNTRFGLYSDASQAAKYAPDYTGYGYATGTNNLQDYLARRATRTPFQGQVGAGVVALGSSQHAALGQQRRLVTAPVLDCTTWNGGRGSAKPPVLDLACVLLLAPVRVSSRPSGEGVSNTIDIEYLGLLGGAGAPCASTGVVGGTTGPAVPGLVQ